MKKPISLIVMAFGFLMLPFAATVQAACTDADGDGYYTCEAADDTLSPFAKGKEQSVCDQVLITQDTDGADQIIAPDVDSVAGKEVNPGQIEAPNSKVDANCDGKIEGYLPEGKGGGKDLFVVIQEIIVLIGKVAVFISAGALVYGGIMFATAAGDEAKIQKAKKTIIGAVVGLAIGLIAWNIVGFITSTLG